MFSSLCYVHQTRAHGGKQSYKDCIFHFFNGKSDCNGDATKVLNVGELADGCVETGTWKVVDGRALLKRGCGL